ncbi:MAG: hypothetical protein WCG87_12855 [Bacteroidota bacterium]
MNKKILVIFATFLILGPIIFYTGTYGYAKYIAHSYECSSFNTDNIVLRTQTDIPTTSGSTCHYDAAHQTKATLFNIDISKVNLQKYISLNNFKKVPAPDSLHLFTYQNDWNTTLKGMATSTSLYIKYGTHTPEGESIKDTWLYVLDSVKGLLYTEVVRTDK